MDQIKKIYNKYSGVIVPTVLFVLSLIVVTQVVIPSFENIGNLSEQLSTEKVQLDRYKNSVKVLNSLSDTSLVQYVRATTLALPPEKNMESIYLAISKAAAQSGVTTTGFSITVGDVYNKSGSKTIKNSEFLSVTLKLSNVDASSLSSFSRELLNASPLSKIQSVSISGNSADMSIAFYYKPYDVSFINRNDITDLSQEDINSLSNLPSQ